MTIQEQIEGCVWNNAKAQEYVFSQYSKRLMAVCRRYFYSIEDAEDSLTEAFILVFKNIKQYRGEFDEKIFYAWLNAIVINTCLTKIRKNKKTAFQESLEGHEYHLEDETIYDSFGAKDLLKIIHSLPTGFRTIFNLYAIEGYSHAEIGKMLGISEGTSKSQYSRAKNHLRAKLEKMGITNSMVETQ